MTLGTAFWILMFVWLIFGLAAHFNWGGASTYGPLGSTLLLFILFFLLGWSEFGPILRRG